MYVIYVTVFQDLIRDRAIELIQGFKADEPFFMYVAFSAVHGPLAVSSCTDLASSFLVYQM